MWEADEPSLGADVDWDDEASSLPESLLENGKVKSWNKLSGCHPQFTLTTEQSLYGARIVADHWDRVRDQTAAVQGCFWNHGSRTATAAMYIPGDDGNDADDDAANAERRRKRRDAHGTQYTAQDSFGRRIACPAGFFSSASDGYKCTACASGQFKSANMAADGQCSSKSSGCVGAQFGHRRFTSLELFGTESTTQDDTMCVPNKFCPAGAEKKLDANGGYSCEKCPDGAHSNGFSETPCAPKTLLTCNEGQYWVQGASVTHNDNMCIPCPAGAYQPNRTGVHKATAPSTAQNYYGSACLPKSWPPSCSAGQFVSAGESATESDNLCAACPTGQYTPNAHSERSCITKNITECAPGTYFHTLGSNVADDNVCIPCPPGSYLSSTSDATVCQAKNPVHCDKSGVYLHMGTSHTSDDNYCVPDGKCAAGYFKDAQGCTVCPSGMYSASMSDGANCTAKTTTPQVCPVGTFAVHGGSTTKNDAVCVGCPVGTFNNDTASVCYLKSTRQTTCGAGFHVSPYTSITEDDSPCVLCPDGTYTEGTTTETRCTLKLLPTDPCSAGQFLSKGGSTTRNDWECTVCDENSFTDAPNSFLQCTPKTDATACGIGQNLSLSNVPSADNLCFTPGRCNAGEQVASDKESCDPCAAGKFNKYVTTSQTACLSKTRPSRCESGQYVSLGTSALRNDWRCATCSVGQYRKDGFDVTWITAGASDTVPEEQASCDQKDGEPPGSCSDAAADHYDPTSTFFRGVSTTRNDYECQPRPISVALCQRHYKENTVSALGGLRAGMPELQQPFTKLYHASIVTPGYGRVKTEAAVVVVGSRFVSDAERVPFPQSRPL